MILQKLKQDAEAYLGEPVEQAVITVPAYFTDAQRQATKDAGTIAGLEVLRIINEPTAAALSFGLDKQDEEQIVLVFDLGGGTFDVSILQLGDGVIEVQSTAGNNHLGGDDFDGVIVTWMIDSFKEHEGIDLSVDKMALQRLREAAEKAKIELSNMVTTSINLPFITADESGPKHLEMELTRAKFEALCADLIQGTIDPVAQALKDAGLSSQDIDRILLVGGSTRIPAVQEAIRHYFDGKSPERSVNPDEAVAQGAAIQGGVLGGEVKDLLLLDVTPLSLGIETLGEVFTKIIERNTTIPTSKSQVFSTATDAQTSVEIHVLQGERPLARDNKSLGKFILAGIPPAPRGVPQIEVTFAIDANGILKVSARDRGTNREQSIKITNTGGLSANEVERMRQEAEVYAEADGRRRQMVELQNQMDSILYSYESTLKENPDAIREEIKTQINNHTRTLRALFKDDTVSPDVVREKINELQQTILLVGSALYGRSGSSSNGYSGASPSPQASPPPMPMGEMDSEYEGDETVAADYEAVE